MAAYRTMLPHIRKERKSYAMSRMAEAIGRAIKSTSLADKDRAARWAAAWGIIGGIRTPGIRLRRNGLFNEQNDRRRGY